jgi:hypothetical protein
VYGSPASVDVDTSAPTVTSFAATSPSASLTISITAFSASDSVGVTGYTITTSSTPPAAGATGWTASAPTTYIVAGDGIYTLYPWARDAAGNVSAAVGAPASVTVETTAPTVVSSELINNNPTNAASVDYIVTFSEGVSGVDTSDFSLTSSGVTGASITGVGGSGATRIISVNTGSGDGTIRLDVLDDDSIQDGIGNALNGGLTSGQSYTIDKTAPTVVSSVRANASPTSAASVDYIVTFSESVTGVDVTDFSLLTSGGSDAYASAVSGSGAIYTVSINTGSASATFRLDVLDDDTVIDLAGNTQSGDLTSGESYTIDKTAPTVVSSARVSTNPSNAASVNFIVTFSEDVSGVNTSDFSLASSGVTGASITGVGGSGSTRTVSVNTGSGSGTLRLNLLDDDSITDSAGNPLGGSGLANGSFLTGQFYTIDKTAPAAGSMAAPNVTLGGSTTYSFTVTFSDNLAIDSASLGAGDIRVTGPTGFNQLATLVRVTPAGSGTSRTATYQITAPGGAWDSADGGTYTIALEANQVFDSAGNPVSAGTLGSFLVRLNYTIYLPLVVR